MSISETEIRAVLWSIHAVFPHRFPLPEDDRRKNAMIKIWQTLLNDLPEGFALAATKSALGDSQHPPKPGDIRRRALANELETTPGADAWGEVVRAIGKFGRDREPIFSDSAITESVRAIGGWTSVCNSRNAVSDRARFIDHFESVQNQAKARVLAGLAPSIASAIKTRHKRLTGPSLASRFLGPGNDG